MPKNNKKEIYPKNYEITINKHGPETNITVELKDTLLVPPSNHMTLYVSGITKNNMHNIADLFNVMHVALHHIADARYPDETDQVMNYSDGFVEKVAHDLDCALEVNNGGNIELTIPSMNFYAVFPSSEKSRESFAKNHKMIYGFNFYGNNGDRAIPE